MIFFNLPFIYQMAIIAIVLGSIASYLLYRMIKEKLI